MSVKKFRQQDYDDEFKSKREYRSEKRIDKYPQTIYTMMSDEELDFDELELNEDEQ
jgi:hypothetical protein